jgi:hypothetical protein
MFIFVQQNKTQRWAEQGRKAGTFAKHKQFQ